jgi:hypothetical protein
VGSADRRVHGSSVGLDANARADFAGTGIAAQDRFHAHALLLLTLTLILVTNLEGTRDAGGLARELPKELAGNPSVARAATEWVTVRISYQMRAWFKGPWR